MESIYSYPKHGWWKLKAGLAKTMTIEALQFARRDCLETIELGMIENQGKYLDESSIYSMELARRKV